MKEDKPQHSANIRVAVATGNVDCLDEMGQDGCLTELSGYLPQPIRDHSAQGACKMSASSIVIYHNPRCGKSRQTLQLLRDAGHEPHVVEYLKTPLTTVELDAVLKKLKLAPRDVMRKGEAVYQQLGLGERDVPRAEALQLLVENPILIERPIVVRGSKAVLGRPPENVVSLL